MSGSLLIKCLLPLMGIFTAIGIPKQTQPKKLLFKDATYEEEIRTVQLYPLNSNTDNLLSPPVANIDENRLRLEFDDLVEAPETYRAKIIHCNANWEKSSLSNLDFIDQFNEFNITNYELSIDTKVAYVHYWMDLPQVKIPGNYLLIVYRGSDEQDILLSRRFMVFSQMTTIRIPSKLNGLTSIDRSNQQIEFVVNYSNYDLVNPSQNVKVVLRQNQRWDNQITGLKPSFIRENINELEYRFFNFENNFKAGNEFRFFDMRSIISPGQNVAIINKKTYPRTVQIMVDPIRELQAYAQYNDLNGNYFIRNNDQGGGSVESDYFNTRFVLETGKEINGEVYIVGKMNDYDLSEDNKLNYDPTAKKYFGQLLLKQGVYNYQYYVRGDQVDSNLLEGNHFETENEYEVFIYYQPINFRGDLLIGYTSFVMNRRDGVGIRFK